MQQIYRQWQLSSQNATSYRAKYILATEILKSDMSSREIRRVARRVVRALEAVIDLPIAGADVLRTAREHFGALTELLAAIEPQPAGDDAHCPEPRGPRQQADVTLGLGGREGSAPDMAPSGFELTQQDRHVGKQSVNRLTLRPN
ncbi:hypothetical protein PYR71_23525 [Rhizobium sp. MC63]|uniref:Uncharacterized protein n=1 Tax=Rhizobium mulingense TaxID=3031128 RepID=A0ACC6N2V8_9HYPH|nr:MULTISPECIES: hypothetical protein [unclassified Rhizobium]MDF0699420.1 hypothetical protein [Rhizobium sp. MC63]MEA3519737.1 hypothetical protein [Rhizobium sp. MJ31]